MPDFRTLLDKPAGQAVKPPPLPGGDYPAVVTGHEMGESAQKKTPFVKFNFRLTGFPEDVDAADTQGIDLEKRSQKSDFYLTDDAMWRLDEFLKSLGLELDGKSYSEAFREAVGQDVTLTIVQKMATDGSENIYANVTKALGGHGTV